MSTELILGVGLFVFGVNIVGVYIFLRIKFKQWHDLDAD